MFDAVTDILLILLRFLLIVTKSTENYSITEINWLGRQKLKSSDNEILTP